MKISGFRSTLLLLCLLTPFSLRAQDNLQSLGSFLPDGEGRELVANHCTRCHSSERIHQVIVESGGGDEHFWRALVGQMIRVFNAPIASHEVDPIVAYLARNFGPSDGVPAVGSDIIGADPDDELYSFLPNDEGKTLITLYCTTCHHASGVRQNIAKRAGRDQNYWNTLVRRMVTTWNAPIADEDIEPIITYLTKHFGPSWGAP
ncbi:MAG: hypothetical protein V3R94_09205 [Acidobacteriota bacterium]